MTERETRLRQALSESLDWIDRLCVSEDVDPQHIRAGMDVEGETLASALARFRAALNTSPEPVSVSPENERDRAWARDGSGAEASADVAELLEIVRAYVRLGPPGRAGNKAKALLARLGEAV